MPPLEVGIVIISFRGRERLASLRDAIAASSLRPQEVVLVDDASGDGTAVWMREHWPEAECVVLPENLGPGGARNAGLERMHAPWVLFIDNDALLTPPCLLAFERAIAAHPRVVAWQARIVDANDLQLIHCDGGTLHPAGLMRLKNGHTPRTQATPPTTLDALMTTAVLVRRDVALALGGFAVEHHSAHEDMDFSVGLQRCGYAIRAVPDAEVLHGDGTAGISARPGQAYPARRTRLLVRNHLWTLVRWRSGPAWLHTLPLLILHQLIQGSEAILKGRGAAWFEGLLSASEGLPRRLDERAQFARMAHVLEHEFLSKGPLPINPALRPKHPLARRLLGLVEGLFDGLWGLASSSLRRCAERQASR